MTAPGSIQIELQLFATLAAYLPPGSVEGSCRVQLAYSLTAAQLVRSLGIPDELPTMVLVNGVDVLDADIPLRDGDVVSVFPPLAGGSGRVGSPRPVEGFCSAMDFT